MRVSSTELQNNFGKYLMLATHEDIIVTRNGTEIAKLTSIEKNKQNQTIFIEHIKENFSLDGFGQKATYDEFMKLRQESEERYEYIDGEIHLLASPNTKHQIAVGELYFNFYNFFQGKDCTPIIAPYDIELKKPTGQISTVQPDLVVICDLEKSLNEDESYKDIPSLTVEVLSKSTRDKDLILKLNLYKDCSVKEYWIVNLENKEVTIYEFEDKNIKQLTTYRHNEIAHSYLYDDLKIDVKKLFRETIF